MGSSNKRVFDERVKQGNLVKESGERQGKKYNEGGRGGRRERGMVWREVKKRRRGRGYIEEVKKGGKGRHSKGVKGKGGEEG